MKNTALKLCSLFAVTAVCVIGLYVFYSSRALTYLADDSRYCINCHAMNTQYATWKQSPHALAAECVDCHLPKVNMITKYIAKAEIGARDVAAFTLDMYPNSIAISDMNAARVQNNCINCHRKTVETLMYNSLGHSNFTDGYVTSGRRCWDCHQNAAHDNVRGLAATPDNLSTKGE